MTRHSQQAGTVVIDSVRLEPYVHVHHYIQLPSLLVLAGKPL